MPKVYEAGGKLYEALVAFALNKKGVEYHWEETLPGSGVISDFVLYKDNKPYMVLLVTHSSAEAGTAIKYWRNVEELFDLKLIDNTLVVCSVTFFGKWKDELLKISTAIFDCNFSIMEKEYAEEFDQLLSEKILPIIGKASKKDTVSIIQSVATKDKELAICIEKFEKDFEREVLSANRNEQLDSLWLLEKKKLSSNPNFSCTLHDTWFKAGLIKLAFLNPSERKEIYDRVLSAKQLSDDTSKRLKLLCFSDNTRRIGRIDAHIDYVVRQIPVKTIEAVLIEVESKYGTKVTGYLDFVRDTNTLKEYIDTDISIILHEPKENSIRYIIDSIKSSYFPSTRKRNAFLDNCFFICKYLDPKFSYDVIVREGKITRGTGPDRFGGIDRCLIGEGLPSDETLNKMANVIYDRLMSRKSYDGLLEKIVYDAVHQNYVTLVKHRTVNYLHELIRIKLAELGWTIDKYEIGFRSCISEYADAPLNTGDPSFTFSISKSGTKMLCHVICAYTSTHKHKEFPGKLRTVQFSCTKNNNQISFVENPNFNYEKVVLILDGCWSQLFSNEEKLIKAFQNSGWSRIISMDEFWKLTALD